MKRQIIRIDEEKCNGCGACVPACVEGALRIIDGKARLVSDVFCDGLGACLGDCPQGALTIEEREAPAFDEEAALANAATSQTGAGQTAQPAQFVQRVPAAPVHAAAHAGGCPGSRAMSLGGRAAAPTRVPSPEGLPSELAHWPVQLMLLPVRAPFWQGSDLLVCADCVPFAYPDFHRGLLRGHAVAVGCPKLDDANFYVEKMAAIFQANDIHSVTVAHMEVPCCSGLVRVVRKALEQAEKDLPVRDLTVTARGELVG